MLQNKKYYSYANRHAVDVLAMEEMDRALREDSPLAKTYRLKDAYGDEREYLVEFAGLAKDDLYALSTSSGALQYLHGTRIPFTAIVDPHTGEEMYAWTGVKSAKEYVKIIAEHEEKLVAKYGAGVDRKLWEAIGACEVELDVLLGDGKLIEAIAEFRKLEESAVRPPDAAKERLEACRRVLERDAETKIAEYEKLAAAGDGKAVRREAAALAKALAGTPLGDRAAKLLE